MDNRRLLLAAFLSFVAVILWGRFVQPPPLVQPAGEADEGFSSSPSMATPESRDVPGSTDESAGPEPATIGETVDLESEAPAEPAISAAAEETVVIETPRYRAELTNRGAQLRSFVLSRSMSSAGEPLEMVRRRGTDPYLFGLRAADDSEHPLNDALFDVERQTLGEGVEEVRFRYRNGGLAGEKVFRFQPSGLIDVDLSVAGPDGWSVLFGPGIRNVDKDDENRFLQRMATYELGDDDETVLPGKQKEPIILPAGGLRWVTLEDNYFLNAVVPKEGVRDVVIAPVRRRDEGAADAARFVAYERGMEDEDLIPDQEIRLRAMGSDLSLTTYLGAKRYRELIKMPYGLDRTLRWGMFGFVVRPLYYGLVWIYERIPNYGWAIVLMTIVIKLLFFPLTHKSQKSMAKMQEVSPKVQALRQRYRSKLKDKQGRPNPEANRQMNEEMMALYKKAGVNPASGCLPVLIQIPVFFSFYRLLTTAVELRNAPWLGWVQDLSAPDPYYLLPVGMLVTSVLLQRMTPPPPDPMQRRMMQMFPIMFGVFAITFPAGLVLYWMTNNILTMGQQAVYLQSKKKREEA